MKNEGLFLIAFVVLAMILLIMVVRADSREHYEDLPVNTTLAISTLKDNVDDLDSRTSAVEKTLADQKKQLAKSTMAVDNATSGIQMITA
jgi:hypothetical protein